MLTAAVYPELHEQALRQSNHKFVTQTFNAKELAGELAYDFNDTLSVFIADNDLPKSGHHYAKWVRDLGVVFTAAADLRARTMLRGQDCNFWWPRMGIPFDPMTMTTEGDTEDYHDRAVQMALFPALLQKSGRKDQGVQEEQAVLHATVLLQKGVSA